jgi:hypothetical protein
MIKGIYTCIKYKGELIDGQWAPSGDPIEVVEKENNIQYKYLDAVMLNQGFLTETSTSEPLVFISEIPQKGMLYANINSTSQWVQGSREDLAFWTNAVYDPVDPTSGYWTIRTRFVPPVATRYIRALAVGRSSRSLGTISCVNLEEPCIQATDEILDIVFRLFVSLQPVVDGIVDIEQKKADQFGKGALVGLSTSSLTASYYPLVRGFEQSRWDLPGTFPTTVSWNSTSALGATRSVDRSSASSLLFGHLIDIPFPGATRELHHGMLLRSIMIGSGKTTKLLFRPVNRPGVSAVQHIFPRAADVGGYRLPFLDGDNIGTSNAVVSVTDSGTWKVATNDMFAYHYRVEITTGGLVGTAEYRIRRRRCTGWNYASQFPMVSVIPSMKPLPTSETIDLTDSVRHGQADDNIVQEYFWPEFITLDATGITIMNVDGTFENVDANSTIPLNVTGLLQVASEYDLGPVEKNSNLFIACEDTGLWKVERPSGGPVTAITQITPVGITNPNSCRGVTVNKNTGEIWALFHDTTDSILYLGKSADQGSTWTLYDETTDPQFLITNYTNGVPGPTQVIGLHIDPYHPDNRLFICSPGTFTPIFNTGEQGTWWSEAGSTPTSDAVRLNYTTSGSDDALGALFTKIRAGLGATQLQTGEWIFRGKEVNESSLAAWGATTTLLAVRTSNTSAFPAMGYNQPIVLDDTNGVERIFGNAAPTTGSNGTVSNRLIVLRTANQYTANNPTGSIVLHDFNSPVESLLEDPNTPSYPTRDLGVGPTVHAYQILAYIGNGVFVSKVQSDPDSPYCFITFYGPGLIAEENNIPWFESYGWNGSGWELNHPNSKVTHALDEDLLDTLQISFDDNGGSDPLVVGEYYDTYAYDGLIISDAVSLQQTVYHFMQATEEGTDFTPSTVPVSPPGAVLNDPLCLLHQGRETGRLGLGQPYAWGLPGQLIAGGTGTVSTSSTEAGYFEHRLSGDFELRFKMVDCFDSELRLGLTNWADIASTPYSLSMISSGHRFHIAYNRTAVNNPSGTINYAVRIAVAGLWSATATATVTKTNASEDDVLALRRVGSTITFLINDVVEYTFPTATPQDLGLSFANSLSGSGGWTLYDGELDYTINRHYVTIGDGVSTGASDPNFARMALERLEQLELEVFLDGVPAAILTDGLTDPAPGEVNILPYSGRIWCNAADAGRAVTGRWRIIKKLNLE